MIVTKPTITLTQSKDFETRSFGIKSDGLAHILDILRNQLYSDKILAVVREYTTNAIDSHRSVGLTDQAIEIKLPNRFHLSFECRDFGEGLSPDGIYNTYVMYGESTKRGNNNEVGEKGIGSKCAFAYGDSFLIESFHEGTHYIYNAVIDESGVGQVSLLNSAKSDEPSGMKIVVPVKAVDCDSFYQKAANLYAWFPIVPNVINTDQTEWKAALERIKGTAIISGDNWSIRDQGETVIRMGCLTYPLNADALNLKYNSQLYRIVQNYNMFIDVPIGTINITASREEISYDETTIATITNKLIEIESKLVAILEEDILRSATLWEAREKAIRLNTEATEVLLGSIRWKGHKVLEYKYTFRDDELNIHALSLQTCGSGKRVRHLRGLRSITHRTEEASPVTYLYVWDDLPSKGKCINGRIYPLLKGLEADYDFQTYDRVVILRQLANYQSVQARDGFDMPGIVLLSSLKKYKNSEIHGYQGNQSTTGKTVCSKAVSRQLKLRDDLSLSTKLKDCFEVSSIDLDAGGVCFEVSSFKINSRSPYRFSEELNKHAKALNIDLPPLYGFKPKTFEKCISKGNWITVHEWFKITASKKLTPSLILKLKHELVFSQLCISKMALGFDDLEEISKIVTKTNPDHKFIKMFNNLNESMKASGGSQALTVILNKYEVDTNKETDKNPLENVAETMLRSYPVMEYLELVYYNKVKQKKINECVANLIINLN